MNEDIFDVLIYLFENYMDSEIDIIPDTDLLQTELKAAGFNSGIILKAFEWLDTLALQEEPVFKSEQNFRIFVQKSATNWIWSVVTLFCFYKA